MQYETIFDVHNAFPLRWSGLVFGIAVIILFLMARFKQQALQSPDVRERLSAWVPRPFWPRSWKPYFDFLSEALVMAIIELAIMAAPRWRWGVAGGLAILGLWGWQFYSDLSQIRALQNPGATQTVEGPVTRIGSSVNNDHERYGYIEVGGKFFRYRDDQAGSPFNPTNLVLFKGDPVRLTYIGDRITRVERPLCHQYTRCTVSYILGIRFEWDAD